MTVDPASMSGSECEEEVDIVITTALSATVRMGVATTNELAHLVLDNTIGRLLDTNPDKVH